MNKEIHVLPLWEGNLYGGVEINTTSNSGLYKDLSPFILGPIDENGLHSENFENFWQFSKVYKEHLDKFGQIIPEWFDWRERGFITKRAIRYPLGKGAIPEFSYWKGQKLNYVEARKKIYAPIYAKYVKDTESYNFIEDIYNSGETLVLKDYDAYDHLQIGLSLKEVINNPNRKCGHAFVLAMMLTGVLEECLK